MSGQCFFYRRKTADFELLQLDRFDSLLQLDRFDSLLQFPKENATLWVAIAVQDTVVE